jgi:hypothetical protein
LFVFASLDGDVRVRLPALPELASRPEAGSAEFPRGTARSPPPFPLPEPAAVRGR